MAHVGGLIPGLTAQATPFLKWAGGKGQLLAQLEPLLPASFRRYVEPFLGGGALFFRLRNLGRIEHGATLSDVNPELINCYRVLQDAESVPELLRLLRTHARHRLSAEHYYSVRAWDRDPAFVQRFSPAERAARAIFLNHTCPQEVGRPEQRTAREPVSSS
ncbi:MAG: hypothetical protein FJ291_15845 [Planctomycetes bacterium]|nr:hypothetical protein [Planctomycetota bacterium]